MLESKRRAFIFFIIAILFAGIAGYFTLKKVQTINADLGTMVEVYVSSRDIQSRALLTPADVTTEEIPQRFIRDEYLTKEEVEEEGALANKVSTIPLSEGQIITTAMLKDMSTITEAGNRLVALVKSDKIFFDETLEALDRVDIIVSKDVDGEKVTEVFMKDVKVARTAGVGTDFNGVLVEIPFDEVTDIIHEQNYAERIRIVRANVGETPFEEILDEEEPGVESENESDGDDVE